MIALYGFLNRLCVCVCVCVCVRARVYVCVCVCVFAWLYMSVYVECDCIWSPDDWEVPSACRGQILRFQWLQAQCWGRRIICAITFVNFGVGYTRLADTPSMWWYGPDTSLLHFRDVLQTGGCEGHHLVPSVHSRQSYIDFGNSQFHGLKVQSSDTPVSRQFTRRAEFQTSQTRLR